MERKYRLTRAGDIKRVRLNGRSIAHPLLVLYALSNGLEVYRIGVAAGKSLGGAVQRNRAKRLIRAAFQTQLENLQPGWDLLVLARRPLASATFQQTRQALDALLLRAKLIKDLDVG